MSRSLFILVEVVLRSKLGSTVLLNSTLRGQLTLRACVQCGGGGGLASVAPNFYYWFVLHFSFVGLLSYFWVSFFIFLGLFFCCGSLLIQSVAPNFYYWFVLYFSFVGLLSYF